MESDAAGARDGLAHERCPRNIEIRAGTAARRAYRAELAAERLTGCPAEPFVNAAMKWGAEAEPLARAAYEAEKGVLVEEVAFIAHPEIPMSGASPDGLVNDDGMIEIKCPNTVTHIEYLINNAVPAEYHAQMLWQMECAGRAWCDFVSFDPRLPQDLQLFVMRFHRDDAKLAILREAVVKFLREVDGMVEALRRTSAAA